MLLLLLLLLVVVLVLLERPADAVRLAVESARVAQVLPGDVATPQWSLHRATVGTLAIF